MPDRIDARPLIAGIGAIALLVGLFLDWYAPGGTAWQLFEAWDVILAALALAVIYSAVEEILGRAAFAERWFLALAGAAFLIVLSQILDAPPAAVEADRETGAWLALTGAATMLLAGLLSTARISVSLVSDRDGPGAGRTDEREAIPETEPVAPGDRDSGQ